MDDMDICLRWPGWPMDDDGLKRSSATLLRIVPKDGKTPGCSTDQTLLASLTISYQPKGHEPHAKGQPHLHLPAPFFTPFHLFSLHSAQFIDLCRPSPCRAPILTARTAPLTRSTGWRLSFNA